MVSCFQIGSNPIDAESALELVKAVEENDSSALTHMDLTVGCLEVHKVSL
jgi:hypothetical protein